MTADSPRPNTPRLLSDLEASVRAVCRGSIGGNGYHGLALRAAVAKAVEFAVFVWQEPAPPSGFFLTATLRGVCEDLIVLSFLERFSEGDRAEAVKLLTRLNLAEGVEAQKAFFESERPWQPVLEKPARSGNVELALRQLSKRAAGWSGKQPWPSVWFMARACGMEALYSYLYSATSKWVHFTPHVLLRMGWGGTEHGLGEHTEWEFTTGNFGAYYTEFNQVYSLYLVIHLLRGPARSLLSGDSEGRVLDELQVALDETLRWPETVTFEEMNIEGPPTLMRIAMMVARSRPKPGST